MSETVKRVVRAVVPRPVRDGIRAFQRRAWWAGMQARHGVGLDTRIRIRDGFELVSHPAAYRLAYFAQHEDPEQVVEFDSFLAECSPGMLLFDVGAHFGLFSLAALHYGGAGARAIAVDASPSAAGMIELQAGLNKVSGRLRVVCAAAGAAVGSVEMNATEVAGGGYYVPLARGVAPVKRALTPLTTIDALAAEHGTPTHIKIDVEGWEADVLRGGREVLTGAMPPKLFIEVHSAMIRERGARPEEVLELLAEYGYRVFDPGGGHRETAQVVAPKLTRIVALPAGVAPATTRAAGTRGVAGRV